ncbi:MAG: DUF711 family protein [Anaerolineae bacterium]
MKIRSVTCFVDVDETLAAPSLIQAGKLSAAARTAVPLHGYELVTTRLAVQPLDRILPPGVPVRAVADFGVAFEKTFRTLGFDYGALMVEGPPLSAYLPELLRSTGSVFASRRIASRADGIDLEAIQDAAAIIYELAHSTPDGFGNFTFAAAANCPPGVPFFPAAYAAGSVGAFAFATEAADLAVDIFTRAVNLEQARQELVAAVEREGARLAVLGQALADATELAFTGIDFSLAPYPSEARSLGTAFERLTGAPFGAHGTLFTAAFITDCLRRAKYPRAGFSGLMLPVLEDWTLAARSRENLYSLDSLLLYSTVCGTGLDTVPLAGDTTQGAIAALLLDLAALSVKLDKPLTARLIPVPGLKAGDVTTFNFEWFSNARAFEVRGKNLKVFDAKERVQFI